MENLKDYREKKEGIVSPKTLIKNLLAHIEQEDDIEEIIYVSKSKNGTINCGHSTEYPTKHIGLLEIGKRMMVDDMLSD